MTGTRAIGISALLGAALLAGCSGERAQATRPG